MTVTTASTAVPCAGLHAALRADLEEAARQREAQLHALPTCDGDVVARAHRVSVERILSEITAALARLDAGTFGRCERCGTTLREDRLARRPWTAHCTGCAGR